jgi:Rhodopirellula transposase DDE domain
MGRAAYPQADALFTADAGGSNGYRSRAWKQELQRLADDLRLRIHVSHFPPGTSKWNKIEHRLFCDITENCRGRALHNFETVVALIGHTRTATGLRVKAKLDTRRYPTGCVVTQPRSLSTSARSSPSVDPLRCQASRSLPHSTCYDWPIRTPAAKSCRCAFHGGWNYELRPRPS